MFIEKQGASLPISVSDPLNRPTNLIRRRDRHPCLRPYNFNPIVSKERQYHVFEDVKKEVHILWAFLLSH